MKVPLFIRVLPIYACIGVLVYVPVYQRKVYAAKVAAAEVAAQTKLDQKPKRKIIPKVEGKPVRLLIPSLSIDITIIDGVYDEKKAQWTVANNVANYAVTSPLINNKRGNTVIYGHYFDWVLGKTRDIKAEATMYVYDQDDRIYEYKLATQTQVNPTDTYVLQDSNEPIISLITCDGAWAQFRRVMEFKFVRVS